MATSTEIKTYTYHKAGYPSNLTASTTSTLPADPKPHHIILRVKACALNPVDIQLMNLPFHNLPFRDFAKTPGCDFSGIITAVSTEAGGEGWSVGDEVMGLGIGAAIGFLQEIVHVDVRSLTMIKKPPRFDWVKAASLPLVWLTARTTIEAVKGSVEGGNGADGLGEDRKLVVLGGSSSTGIYTVLQAKKRGWKVLATCSGRNAEFVKGLGADEVVDYTTTKTAVVDGVKNFEPKAVIDDVGGTECIGLANQYVTIVGDKTSRAMLGGPATYYTNPQMVVRWLLGYLGIGKKYDCLILSGRKDWLEEVNELKPEDVVIDSVFKFEDVKKAYEKLDTGRARGKVVVTVSE